MMIGVGKIPRAKGSRTRLEEFRRKLVIQARSMAKVALHLDNVPPSTAVMSDKTQTDQGPETRPDAVARVA